MMLLRSPLRCTPCGLGAQAFKDLSSSELPKGSGMTEGLQPPSHLASHPSPSRLELGWCP
eukprot:4496130-Pyramimonas_sp.AAC.1